MTTQDWRNIMDLATFLLPALLGLLLPSPLFKWMPAKYKKALAELHPEDLQAVKDHLLTKDGRHDTAVDLLYKLAQKRAGWVSRDMADWLVTYLEKVYKKEIARRKAA